MAELFTTDFPIYSVCEQENGIFHVAGGGGKAKTGIPNILEVRQIEKSQFYFSDILCRHNMSDELIRQSTSSPNDSFTLAASVGKECHIYHITDEGPKTDDKGSDEVEELGPQDVKESEECDDEQSDSISFRKDIVSEKKEEEKMEVEEEKRQVEEEKSQVEEDKSDLQEVNDKDDLSKDFEVIKTASVVTDEATKDACQNVVRFTCDGDHVVTGGEDGKLRVWKLPVLKLKDVLEGHESEITDLATHPTKQICVSVSRDCTARVWDLKKCCEIEKFQWSRGKGRYRFRACCFSSDGEKTGFFSINIPVKWDSSRPCSYLVKWDTTKWVELKSVKTGSDILTTIASCGQYIAIGNTNGDIGVYSIAKLKPILRLRDVHASFVTGMCFISSPDKKVDKKNDTDPLLLSVSVDKRCCVTVVKRRGTSWILIFVFLSLILLVVAIATEVLS